MVNRGRCWSDLPSDLLERIGKKLNNGRIDVSVFRAVCRSWRFSLPPFSKQAFPPIIYEMNNATFTLSADTFVYHLTTPPPPSDEDCQILERVNWLVMVSEGETPQLLYNRRTLVLVPKKLNSLEFRVTELARAYSLSTSTNNLVLRHCKVAMSSFNADCPELMFLAKDTSANLDCGLEAGLYHCKLIKDKENCYYWCTKVTYEYFTLQDIIFHQGKFYVVTWNGATLEIDTSCYSSPSLMFESIAYPISDPQLDQRSRMSLVESMGELLLVTVPLSYNVISFKVFKLNMIGKQWFRKWHEHWWRDLILKDRKLLVGDDFCFSISSRDCPDLPESGGVFRFPNRESTKR